MQITRLHSDAMKSNVMYSCLLLDFCQGYREEVADLVHQMMACRGQLQTYVIPSGPIVARSWEYGDGVVVVPITRCPVEGSGNLSDALGVQCCNVECIRIAVEATAQPLLFISYYCAFCN